MKGWKTILIAVIQFAVYALGWEQLTQYLEPQTIAIIASVLMFVLRFLTSSPVFKSLSR
jgi:hypothetical protein